MNYLCAVSIFILYENLKNNMKRKNTLVDFVHTFYRCSGVTTEAECVCRLQVEKVGLDSNNVYELIKNRFPFINKNCKFVVTGKSVVNDGESYDETLGKYIAETRAQVKAYSIAERVFDMLKHEVFMIVDNIGNAQANCSKNMVHGLEHVVELIDSIEE